MSKDRKYNWTNDKEFEALASSFRKETGMSSPGKDDCRSIHTQEERTKKWLEWLDGLEDEEIAGIIKDEVSHD